MRKRLVLLGLLATIGARAADDSLPFAGTPAIGQNDTVPPPAPVTPTTEQRKGIETELEEFKAAIQRLKDAKADDDLIVDAEAYGWVVENVMRVPGGFINAAAIGRCSSVLKAGLRRAAEIKAGTAAWPHLKGRVNRAYRSAVDGTAQPYHINVPDSYDPSKAIPLYVYLHGRSHDTPDLGLTWVGGNDGTGAGSAPDGELGARVPSAEGGRPNGRGGNAPYIRVEPFGRGNNSFRWAGETDVFEVIASVRKRYNIDPDRIVLAGFSMGGAGSWQIGLHNPDLFCGLEIDAGVLGNRLNLDGLKPSQQAAIVPYGIMIAHALNASDVPLVAYAGTNDAQLASSTSIREQLGREGYTIKRVSQYQYLGRDIRATFLANPGQGHSHATGETARIINAFTAANIQSGRVTPHHIRFVTYTTRYNRDHWVTLEGLQQHFAQAGVDAERDLAQAHYVLKTSNVSRLLLTEMSAAQTISIDGDMLSVEPASAVRLIRTDDHWQPARSASFAGLRKQHDLQGPINDAFFDSFLCVAPTGRPNNPVADERGRQELDRFTELFARDYCGEARTKADTAVTAEDIANNNLVLFGDPGSNQLLARIVGKLPIHWTQDKIVVGEKTFSAADHVPVLIYPNPLNPMRYVVINTGLVAQDPRGSAGYGDYAVLKVGKQTDGKIVAETEDEGVFDESWQLPAANPHPIPGS